MKKQDFANFEDGKIGTVQNSKIIYPKLFNKSFVLRRPNHLRNTIENWEHFYDQMSRKIQKEFPKLNNETSFTFQNDIYLQNVFFMSQLQFTIIIITVLTKSVPLVAVPNESCTFFLIWIVISSSNNNDNKAMKNNCLFREK